jgi:hypothetical protein
MESANTSARRLTPACIAIVLTTAAVTAAVTWIAFVPRPNESPVMPVALAHKDLAECLAQTLKQAPSLNSTSAGEPDSSTLTILADEPGNATRVIYEGRTRLSFIVTITARGEGESAARLTTIPTASPVAAVEKAVGDCARKN